MAEPATSRPRPETVANGADSSDGRLGELRRLLVGSELAEIARLQRWVDDSDLRAQDLSHLLQTPKIRQSLQNLITNILSRNQQLLTNPAPPSLSYIPTPHVANP